MADDQMSSFSAEDVEAIVTGICRPLEETIAAIPLSALVALPRSGPSDPRSW
jgi:hypothetical protein